MYNRKPIATITQFPIIAYIYDIQYGIDDSVIASVGTVYNIEKIKPRKYKLYYTARRSPYFRKNGIRYYMDEALKVD